MGSIEYCKTHVMYLSFFELNHLIRIIRNEII